MQTNTARSRVVITAEPLQNGLAACQNGGHCACAGNRRRLPFLHAEIYELGAQSRRLPTHQRGTRVERKSEGWSGVADLVACPGGGFRRRARHQRALSGPKLRNPVHQHRSNSFASISQLTSVFLRIKIAREPHQACFFPNHPRRDMRLPG